MEFSPTQPVELIQQLIAIHTTRKENAGKLLAASGEEHSGSRIQEIIKQSEGFIAGLMQELSNFGDAVSSHVERDDEYQLAWKNITGEDGKIPADSDSAIIPQTESILSKIYNEILDKAEELPLALSSLLASQRNAISQPLQDK